ncbi:MAG: hypothetical protein AB7G28_05775 [Pirellulales bacterium]
MSRKLRIAKYTFIGVLGVILAIAWLLSNIAGVALVKTEGAGTQTRYGIDNGYFYMDRRYNAGPATHAWRFEQTELYPRTFMWISGYATRRIMLPIWSVFLILTGVAYAPFRFSLRTMFIASSLVAVMLGLGVWLTS